QRVPQLEGPRGVAPDLVAEVARVARPRDLDRDARDPGWHDAEVLEARDVALGAALQQLAAGGGRRREGRGRLGDVFHLDLEAGAVLAQPAQVRLGRSPAP